MIAMESGGSVFEVLFEDIHQEISLYRRNRISIVLEDSQEENMHTTRGRAVRKCSKPIFSMATPKQVLMTSVNLTHGEEGQYHTWHHPWYYFHRYPAAYEAIRKKNGDTDQQRKRRGPWRTWWWRSKHVDIWIQKVLDKVQSVSYERTPESPTAYRRALESIHSELRTDRDPKDSVELLDGCHVCCTCNSSKSSAHHFQWNSHREEEWWRCAHQDKSVDNSESDKKYIYFIASPWETYWTVGSVSSIFAEYCKRTSWSFCKKEASKTRVVERRRVMGRRQHWSRKG